MTDAVRILHVEDDPDFADLTATVLERDQDAFTVATASSVDEALGILAAASFDCVVADYDMPGATGLDLLERVRADHGDLPFILFTGKGSEEVASEAITAGATDYLQKQPGTEQYDLLANRIHNAVDQYRSRQRAATLDRVRTLLTDVNQALVRARSRAEAEEQVCARVAEASPYEFAWIGAVNPATGVVEPRARSDDLGYLDAVADGGDEDGDTDRPVYRAVRDQHTVLVEDLSAAAGDWRAAAVDCGFRSVAAVPLTHDDAVYGTLAVYSSDPVPFTDEERDLLAELGADVSHAIHSFTVEDRLREERDQRAALFENAPSPVVISRPELDGDEHLVASVNDAFVEVFGYERDEIVGTGATELLVPDDGVGEHVAFRDRAEAGETMTAEVERQTADGRREFVVHIIPFGGDEGRPDGIYVWYLDVTERNERQRELERNQALLHHTEELAGTGGWEIDAETNELEWTAGTYAIHDLSPAEFDPTVDTTIEFYHPDDRDRIERAVERCLTDGEPYDLELRIRTAAGEQRWVHTTGEPRYEDGEIASVRGAIYDVTDHVERERDLERSNSLLSTLIETLPLGVLAEDADRNVLAVNDRMFDLFDLPGTPEDVVGSDCARMAAEVAGMFEDPDRFVERIDEVVAAGDPVREDTLPVRDGRTLARSYRPIDLPGGSGHLWVYRDVTERAEQERSLRAERDRLESFASVVSHDLRNPLNVASGHLALAREGGDDEHLTAVANALDRMDGLIEDLLTLAQEGEDVGEVDAVDLGEAVRGCWATVATGDARVDVQVDAAIRADPGRLKQLLENLFRNAIDHGGDGVTVTVGDLEDGFYVADDGPGIPESERDDVFEAGYSTTEAGTGFGLSIVREIAEAHGWTVTVGESTAGGARFEVRDVDLAP